MLCKERGVVDDAKILIFKQITTQGSVHISEVSVLLMMQRY